MGSFTNHRWTIGKLNSLITSLYPHQILYFINFDIELKTTIVVVLSVKPLPTKNVIYTMKISVNRTYNLIIKAKCAITFLVLDEGKNLLVKQ